MVDAQGMQPHQMALGADKIAVPAGHMQKRPHPQPVLDQIAHGQIAHPGLGQRIVRHGNGVRSGIS
ncbi:hypothetical protein D3C75_1361980 [compost metagenome]